MTLRPDPSGNVDPDLAEPSPRHRGRWIAMLLVLVLGLGVLAAAAVGVANQLMPRRFTVTQQRQIMTWEMTRRWRAYPAGQIFPATLAYELPPTVVESPQGVTLTARRLGIGQPAGCASYVSQGAARLLAQHRCSALIRATYLDSSGSMLVTVAVAVLPDTAAASAAVSALTAPHGRLSSALGTLPVAGTPAAHFTGRQRQLGWALSAGPYVVLATAGFTDGRPRAPLRTDSYYDREMSSLVTGLSGSIAARIGKVPLLPSCPGAPGC